MTNMKREDIEHLAMLARIGITDAEADVFAQDVSNVLSYVSDIEEIAGVVDGEKTVGPLHTVMRVDKNPHEADRYTEAMLKAAPDRSGRYIQVQKILEEKS